MVKTEQATLFQKIENCSKGAKGLANQHSFRTGNAHKMLNGANKPGF